MKASHLLNTALTWITERYKYSYSTIEESCIAFAIFGLINFTVLYHFDAEYPEELVPLLWFGLGMCTLLTLVDYLPQRLAAIKKGYWLLCVFYILSFYSISQIIFTYASAEALLNAILSTFLLIVVTDWLIAISLFALGILASLIYISFYTWTYVSWDFYLRGYDLLYTHLYMTFYFIWALVIATIFLRKIDKKKENYLLKRQLSVTQIIASSIAHELRTPLLTINATLEGLKRFTPTLINSYQVAKDHGLMANEIPDQFYQALHKSLEHASNEIVITNTIINILLIRLRGNYQDKTKIKRFYISEAVKTAIKRYPFNIDNQAELINFNTEHDFECKAIKLLIIHIFFNLLKNALYFIQKVRKGKICIWFEQTPYHNIAYFKDTSAGINKRYLPMLFDEFFSMTSNGTGVGLTFCKLVMRELGGNIKVESIEGEFTTFILTFPKLESKSIEPSEEPND